MMTFIVRKGVYRVGLSFIFTVVLLRPPLVDLLLPGMVSAQESHCDPCLQGPAGYPYGYRLRGDRCEGIYVKDVSSTALFVASLTRSFEDYDLTSGRDLLVQWTAPGDGPVRLRGQGLRPRLYYRMDTCRPPESTSYAWSSNLLAALGVSKKDIGVVGWIPHSFAKTVRNVYLPLRISQEGTPTRPDSYRLVLLPGRELTEVFLSLATVGEDGHPESYLMDGEALGYGYYPAERGIAIPISNLNGPGIYYLEVGATLRGGGATTLELWFYHPGE